MKFEFDNFILDSHKFLGTCCRQGRTCLERLPFKCHGWERKFRLSTCIFGKNFSIFKKMALQSVSLTTYFEQAAGNKY